LNRVERLAAILLMLQEKGRTAEEIARRFEVSRRTVLRDVQALSEMGVPVIAREGPGGGYWLPQEYRAEPLPLNASEAFLLLLAVNAMQGFTDLPFREALASLQVKLRAQLPRGELSNADDLLSAVGKAAQGSESPARRAPFLNLLLEAAREERWVKVVYRSSERISTQHLLPRQVFPQEGFWYCRAYAEEHRQERTYRVDRVQSVDQPESGFHPLPILEGLPFAHESHPRVVARLSAKGAALLEVDRFLGSGLKAREDGGADLDFRCPPYELDYFARVFAGLGQEIEVFDPLELREKLRDLGEILVRRYQ